MADASYSRSESDSGPGAQDKYLQDINYLLWYYFRSRYRPAEIARLILLSNLPFYFATQYYIMKYRNEYF